MTTQDFFILFRQHADIHRILSLAKRNHPANMRTLLVPPQQPTAAQSFRVFCQFLDEVALEAGMIRNKFTCNADNHRQPGLFDGVQQHHADAFELLLNTYVRRLGAGDTLDI